MGQFNSIVVNTIYEGYQDFTIENFVIGNARLNWAKGKINDNIKGWVLNSSNYNATTGILRTPKIGDYGMGGLGMWNSHFI